MFVDPIADVAVFGEPDPAVLPRLQRAYHRLVDRRPRLRVADGTRESAPGQLFTHSGAWSVCTVTLNKPGNTLWLEGKLGRQSNRARQEDHRFWQRKVW